MTREARNVFPRSAKPTAFKHRMKVLKRVDPKTQTILEATIAPVIKGEGVNDYVCGSCETVLIESIGYKQVVDIIFRCADCGSYNAIPTSHHLN